MTQLEKTKIITIDKYEEALKRAKEFVGKEECINLEYIFPELRESEDEKIKKSLINYIKAYGDSGDFTKEEYISWLEKQSESIEVNPTEFDLRLNRLLKQFESLSKEELTSSLSFYLNVIQNDGTYKEEKQCEPNWCHHKVDLSNCSEEYRKAYYDGWNNCNMQYSQCKYDGNDVVKCLINGMKFYYEDNEEATWGTEKFSMKVKDILSWLEKQDKKLPAGFYYVNSEGKKFYSDTFKYGDITLHVEKQGEQNPHDNFEPKFKIEEGKWYVCTQTYVLRGKIVVIKGQTYQAEQDNVIKGEDECLFIDRHDAKASDYFRLWTIQDARDGDVLISLKDKKPLLFKGLLDKEHPNLPVAYCGIGFGDNLGIPEKETTNRWTNGQFSPANKEQHDLLFQKMKEAGYTFDFEKKELKKIE